jgi:ribosome-binding factor A
VKFRNRRRPSPQFVDAEFAAALEGDSDTDVSHERREQHKAAQLCRQVQRALNMALASRGADDDLSDLFVEQVTPAPHCGHLLVHVVAPADRPFADALSALRRDTARLRCEVAAAITRKRAPELSFVPACTRGGSDE